MTHPSALANLEQRRVRLFDRVFRPPPELTISDWADEYRILSEEASAEPGPWRTERVPYLRGIMDAIGDPEIDRVVLMKSAQVGATEALVNTVGYYISQDPSPILYLMPTEREARELSELRLEPMIRDTPLVRRKVAEAKSRSAGNKKLFKRFAGGHITLVGTNSPAGLESRPIRIVLADDVDRFPASVGGEEGEGDPISLAWKRTRTFWNRTLVLASTPTEKGASRIESAFEKSDQRYFYLPCPSCGHYQRLQWAQMIFDRDATAPGETARYECAECEERIEERHKPAMLRAGEWRARRPEHSTVGFHIWEAYSPFSTWSEIVQEFLEKKDDPKTLKTVVNLTFGETWEEEGEEIEAHALSEQLEEFPPGCQSAADVLEADWQVPERAGVLTAAVDVQVDRLEMQVKAWGAGEESWLVYYTQIHGDPAFDDVWDRLDMLLARSWRHERGAQLKIRCTCIDSGGHHTERVYRFCKQRIQRNVFPVKGSSQPRKPFVTNPSTNNSLRVPLFTLGTEVAKDWIFSRLQKEEPGPGKIHLPQWLPPVYLKQLTAEKRVTRKKKGRTYHTYRLKSQSRANEALDMTVYDYAALNILGAEVVNRLGQEVEKVRERVEEAPEEPEPEAEAGSEYRRQEIERRRPSPKSSSWVGAWRD